MAKTTPFIEEVLKVLAAGSSEIRAIPDPDENIESLHTTVAALKEAVEMLLRQRGTQGDSAFLVRELEVLMTFVDQLITNRVTDGITSGVIEVTPTTPVESGNHVVSVTINSEGELVVVFADGTVFNAGSMGRDFIAVYGNTLPSIPLPKETWVTLTNNGEGATSVAYLPPSVDRLLNTATGELDFSGLTEGDGVVLRPDYFVNPSVDKALLKFRYLLGIGDDSYVLERTMGRLDSGSGSEYIQGVLADYVPMMDANTILAPVTMQVWLSEIGELVNNSITIQVIKR
jgi:hypothetical protein